MNLPALLRVSKPAVTHTRFLPLCLSALACCLSPCSLSKAIRPHTTSQCPYLHHCMAAASCSTSIAHQGCLSSSLPPDPFALQCCCARPEALPLPHSQGMGQPKMSLANWYQHQHSWPSLAPQPLLLCEQAGALSQGP